MIQLLVIYDRPAWCYHRRAEALKRYAPDDFHVEAVPWALISEDWGRLAKFDVVYLLDYVQAAFARCMQRMHAPKTKLVVSFNADAKRRRQLWNVVCINSDWVVCVSRERFEKANGWKNCSYIPNGIDCETFQVRTPIEERPHRVLWCGSERSRQVKGYDKFIVPLSKEPRLADFEFDLRLIGPAEPLRDARLMAAWYNTGSYILCASESEGTANTVLEGVACGCVAVSTAVGQITEWGKPGRNCAVAAPMHDAFVAALLCAREQREALSAAGVAAVQAYDYRQYAEKYFALFRTLTEG